MSNRHNKVHQSAGTRRHVRGRWLWLMAIAAQLLLACGGKPKVSPGCPEGTEDCPCRKGHERQCDNDDLVCAGDMCRKSTCKQGSLNCSCYGNLTCDKKSDGTWLVCDQGICEEPKCRQGEAGCGCYPNGTCMDGLKCSESAGSLVCVPMAVCTPGELGCRCGVNNTCASSDAGTVSCVNNTCVISTVTDCTGDINCACKSDGTCNGAALKCDSATKTCVDCVGELNCNCTTGNTCNTSSLSCNAGTHKCVPKGAQCVGTIGCACNPDKSCNSSDLTCSPANLCVAKTCTAGTENCECKGDKTCTGTASNGQELVCLQGSCVASSCHAGQHGCPCAAGDACTEATDTCSNGKCVTKACPEGTAGCACLSGYACGSASNGISLTCVANVCTDCTKQNCVTTGLTLPEDPPCFTPCLQGFADDAGTYHTCDSDGLMRHKAGDHCLDKRTCREGSCLEPGDRVPSCKSDIECPEFQNCVGGNCVAVCDNDLDCPKGLSCHRHACRKTCTSENSTCIDYTACVITDGTNGYCMPVGAPPAAQAVGPVLGTFTLNTQNIAFNSAHTTDTFTITNTGPIAAKFKLTKIEHTENGGLVRETKTPLFWLSMGEVGAEKKDKSFSVIVDPNKPMTISLKEAANSKITSWQGVIEVRSEDLRLGAQQLSLSYTGSVDGRWKGQMHYFANFGTIGLAEWYKGNRNNGSASGTACSNARNALINRWGAFRYSNTSSLADFQAALQSAVKGSWAYADVDAACKTKKYVTCYPFADANNPLGFGVLPFATSSDFPVPSGVTQYDIAIDMQADLSDPSNFTGLIPTSEALHYPAIPALALTFDGNPSSATCPNPMSNSGECVVHATSLSSNINVGGRYLPAVNVDPKTRQVLAGDCADGWQAVDTPWLLAGFTSGTHQNSDNGLFYRRDCRDKTQPGGTDIPASTNSSQKAPSAADIQAYNVALAGANPVPDGRARGRKLELIDGAMVNQDALVLIVKESFDSFLPISDPVPFEVYAVMNLKRTPAEVSTYAGNAPPPIQLAPPDAKLALACPGNLLTKLGNPTGPASESEALSMANELLNGKEPDPNGSLLSDAGGQVHYLCHDTGRIDGGNTKANGGSNYACPAGSNVTFFYFDDQAQPVSPAPTAADIAALPCQSDGTCQQVLTSWLANKTGAIAIDPIYFCDSTATGCQREQVFCDADRTDLRRCKRFYRPIASGPDFPPLRTAINDAFRYKTQFRTRTGKTVGFAPQQCIPNSNAVPYCYDATQIQAVRDRVNCALYIYHKHPDAFTDSTDLYQYLKLNFGYDQSIDSGNNVSTYDGFEMMYAELLVMLGDDAYTNSFTARFDLAGSSKVSFQGSLFEPNGIDLSGGAGYEMYELYQATQYYNLVLERFFQALPYMTDTAGDLTDFIVHKGDTTTTPQIFSSYFPKLIRASAQKTRAFSEIAKRYQNFNRPDLARSVIERAYTSAFIELTVIRNLETRYLQTVSSSRQADAEAALQHAAYTYSAALLDMQDVYRSITDNVTYFGFAPDYIPFPALDPSDTNAFAKLLALANQRVATAAAKEETALNTDRSYETDAASFQSELVKLRINYDNQLADICGTFTGDDGVVYPAVSTYSNKSTKVATLTAAVGDPCGLVSSGKLYDARGQLESIRTDMEEVKNKYDTLFAEIDIEKARVLQQCDKSNEMAVARYKIATAENTLQDDIRDSQLQRSKVSYAIESLNKAFDSSSCLVIVGIAAGSDCLSKGLSLTVWEAAAAVQKAADLQWQQKINEKETQIAAMQAAETYWEGLQGCNTAQIDSNAKIKSELLGLKDIDLSALKAEYGMKLGLSQIKQYEDQARRIANEALEMQEQTVNVEAARNDPNTRIYKNDAIINADKTFDAALAAAYQATKVYEYYTSQSYAHLVDLFLVRMVSHGDYNLESYLTQLQDAYLSFQQQYGNPDDRVDILSLRDDVFQVPRVDNLGAAMSQSDRIAAFRQKLTDVALLDESGYLTVPFATGLSRLSPLTRNHKIKRIEAEVIGSNVGDTTGRVYVRQKGTGIVEAVSGDMTYYRFPEITAVVDTFFNGVRTLSPDIYSTDRLRDRPYMNSRWDLVINQRNESVNMDIDLNSVTDVRLYIYYTDFTTQ